jgi:ADP-heptose:LPS heptosyltransferase/GT2 family glycosyltransferase
MPTLSVAILTRNRLAMLRHCLESLARQNPLPDEVLILDTGSTDGTREWFAARKIGPATVAPETSVSPAAAAADADPLARLSIRFVADSGEGAYAGARNRGVKQAVGEIIAFLDDDCEVDAGWTRRILDRFTADPGLELLGGVTLPAEPLDFPEGWAPEMNWLLGLSVPGCWGPEGGRVHLGQAANLAFRRRVWESVPFGELGESDFASGRAVYESGREDADWWRRARRLGWRAEMDGFLIAWHHIPQQRLRWVEVLERSRRDGRVHWRRGGTPGDVRAALSDLVHLPVCYFETLLRPGTTPREALTQVRLWSERQAALVGEAVRNPRRHVSVAACASMGLQETGRMIAGTAKRAGRKGAALAYRHLRSTRPLPSAESPPRTLLLVSCGYLGDQLLIQPALRMLRRTYPDTRLALLTGGFGAEFHGPEAPEADRAWVDEVIDADVVRRAPLPRRHEWLRSVVRRLDPDAVAIFYAHRLWPLPLFMEGNAPVVGFDRDQGFAQRLWHDLLSVQLKKDWSVHEILNHARLARCLGADGPLERFSIAIPEEMDARVAELLTAKGLTDGKGGGAGFVAVHFGVGQSYKEWPLERWRRVVEWIESETDYEVALLGGRDARAAAERLGARGARARNFCGNLSPRASAALLRRARLLVSADSGPKHLAFAVGTPTLTLYGPSDERRWGALWDRERHAILRRGLSDLTAEDLRGLPDNWAMTQIQVEDVIETLQELLGR